MAGSPPPPPHQASAVSGIIPLLHLGQVVLGAYAAKHSYEAIVRLLKFEEKTEQAAKYSVTAEQELWKTRKTQAAGVAAIILSLISSFWLALAPVIPSHPSSASTKQWHTNLAIYIVNSIVPLGVRLYMGDFWNRKVKVPFVHAYNEAIDETKTLWRHLQWLQWTWIAVGGLELALG